MYMNTGYIFKDDRDIKNTINTNDLTIYSAGCYRLLSQNSLKTYRRKGRMDYQLLYMSQGKGYFIRDNSIYELLEGECILYYPGEIQEYEYFLKDAPEVYWIHFTGSKALDLLDQLPTDSIHRIKIGIHSSYKDLFEKIIREIQLLKTQHQELCALYFKELLIKMIRGNQLELSDKKNKKEIFRQILEDFQTQYNQNIEIQKYAQKNHISTCWLIRGFKKETGYTPQAYIIQIRINKAKELLLYSELSISEIASIIGYDNPLYFSRIFKNHLGLSPRDYRKKHLE